MIDSMTKIAFDKNWMITDPASEEATTFIERSDEGHVRAYHHNFHSSPYSFGSYLPTSSEAFVHIAELLKPVEEMDHFKIAWESFNKDLDLSYAVEYLMEEIPGRNVPNAEEITVFAKLYVSCFPTLLQVFALDYFLYDGFYGYSNTSGRYCNFYSAISYREMVESAIGVWQKDVAREFRNLDLFQAQIASDFSKFLHPNRLAEIMHDAKGQNPMQAFYISFEGIEALPMSVRERLALQSMSQRVIPKASTSEDEFSIEHDNAEQIDAIEDALDMLRYVGKNKIFKGSRSWKDVHDRAMRLAPDIDSDKIVKIPKRIEKLSDSITAETQFEALTFPKEFVDLGDELNICIGKASYFFKSLRNESYCFKVIEDSRTVGALEIAHDKDGWKALQLRGRANGRLPNHDTVIEHILTTLNS